MTEKRIKRQKLGGFGANFLEENLERAILTREILIIFLFFIYPLRQTEGHTDRSILGIDNQNVLRINLMSSKK